MELTAIGLVLIPAGAVVALRRSPLPLLYLLVFFAPFSATALINVPGAGFGIQPAFVLAALLVARFGWWLLAERGVRRLTRAQAESLAPFLLFAAAAVFSVAAIPLYGGETVVTRPSATIEELRVGRENFTQLVYLIFVVGVASAIATVGLGPRAARGVLKVFLISGLFVAAWGWLQIGAWRAGIPYPEEIFNNNLSFRQHFGQIVPALGLKRMTSVAPEPSNLARFLLVPMFLSLYAVYDGRGVPIGRRGAMALCLLFGFTLIATTSSTAAVGLAAGTLLFALFAATRSREARQAGGGLRLLGTITFVAIAVGALGLLAARAWLGLGWEQIRTVIDVLLLGKLEGASGQHRLAGALQGWRLFVEHPLLGVGWGSNRTFDLLTNVLSQTGLAGSLLLAWGYGLLWTRGLRSATGYRIAGRPEMAATIEASLLSLAVLVAAKCLAEPGLAFLDHWILVGLLVAVLEWRLPRDERRGGEGPEVERPVSPPPQLALSPEPTTH